MGSGDAICAISPSSASRPPAIARQDAEGDAAAALVIGFAGWEKNPRHSLEDGTEPAVQFMARAPTGLEGPGPLTSRTRERKLLCGQAQFFMAARPTGLASSRAKSTRSATTRIDVRERRSCSFALIKSAFLIPYLRRAIYLASHIWIGGDTESRYGFILPYDNCMPRLL